MRVRKLIVTVFLISISFFQCFGRKDFIKKATRVQRSQVGMLSSHRKLLRKRRLSNKNYNRDFFYFLRNYYHFGIIPLSLPIMYGGYKIIDLISNKGRPANVKCGVESKDSKEYIPTQFIRKQEGTYWCSIACIQALLKFNGIEMEQRKIYKKVCELGAMQGDGVIPSVFWEYNFLFHMNSLMPLNVSFISAFISVPADKIHLVKIGILDFYNKIDNRIFMIRDNSYSFGHVVIVKEISSDKITIEDSWTGRAYKQSLDAYCDQYVKKKSDAGYVNVFMVGTIKSDESPRRLYYALSKKDKNKLEVTERDLI